MGRALLVRAQPSPFQRHSVGALPPLAPKTAPRAGGRLEVGDRLARRRYWNSGGGGADPSFGMAVIAAVDFEHQVAAAPTGSAPGSTRR